MVNKDKIKNLIQTCRELDINDPAISDQWDLLVEELGTEYEATKFLSEAEDKDLFILSSVFDDLSLKFQSPKFVEFLKRLAECHPAAEMDVDIHFAEQVLNS